MSSGRDDPPGGGPGASFDDDQRSAELSTQLEDQRTTEAPVFRRRVRGQLPADTLDPNLRVRRLIAAYAVSGLLLLAAVAVSLAGAGPLAPG